MNNPIRNVMTLFNVDKFILNQAKKNKSVIYGGQAIKKHIGFIARPTKDYDILSKKPRKHAIQLERTLDKKSGGDFYYTQPALHKGTHKVKHIGVDKIKETEDDFGIADYTKPIRKHKTKTIDGIKYVTLNEIKKDKKRALSLKKFEFRHQKDREDLNRIKLAKSFKIKYRKKILGG